MTGKTDTRLGCLSLCLALGLMLGLSDTQADEVTLLLKNGDRLTGEVLAEDDDRIVLTTPWNAAIFIPRTEIRETVAKPSAEPAGTGAEPAQELATDEADKGKPEAPPQKEAATAKKPAPKAPVVAEAKPPAPRKRLGNWKWNLKVGADFVQGAKDRSLYFGETSVTYTRNYAQSPRQFLRNRLEYRVSYGETDGDVSANRMGAANKLDLDIGARCYTYLAAGAGYDEIRKIEYEYDAGPGLGYHVIAKKALVVDSEIGLNYQYRKGLGTAPDRQLVQGRLGQELTWEVMPKITLTEKAVFLPMMDELGQYQMRVEGTLGFGIVQHLSLNFTVRNLYDTQPAPNVPNNEFQFRSSVGVNF